MSGTEGGEVLPDGRVRLGNGRLTRKCPTCDAVFVWESDTFDAVCIVPPPHRPVAHPEGVTVFVCPNPAEALS